ncbi:chromosome condensation and segregation factor B [Spiroplasma helicoides]|uniref:Chromosome condensation and segregation factor B n=1 Tax=Spiroplasma helicoides TaxID=216938 RepID=A0A1B3SJU6_9MOLU|nr:SMC-Scp complex subunit ScpB [Spiroplasma helicoides]AOG60197.1 chromosome condensation and segregation factor B [Spiroplasma helicoides]
MDFDKKMAIAEGLLFVNGDEGTSLEDLKFILELENDDDVEKVIEDLIAKYEKDKSSGLDIQKFAKSKYRMTTKKQNADFYARLTNVKTETKLSTASIETLSIIAYKGPITKAAVETIRGVGCDAIFYKLKLRNLITDAGKSEEVGKPTLYKVTEDFLKYFNLNSLDDLPKLQDSFEQDKDIFGRE